MDVRNAAQCLELQKQLIKNRYDNYSYAQIFLEEDTRNWVQGLYLGMEGCAWDEVCWLFCLCSPPFLAVPKACRTS